MKRTLGKRIRGIGLAIAAGLLAGLPAPEAGADTPYTFGIGSKATALGGAFTAVADDFSAAYYNPAGLVQSPHGQLQGGWLYANPRIRIRLRRRVQLGDGRMLGSLDVNDRLQTTSGPVSGMVIPIEIHGLRMAFGLASFTPGNGGDLFQLQTSPYEFVAVEPGYNEFVESLGSDVIKSGNQVPIQSPHAPLWESSAQRIMILPALGVKITDQFSVGFGANVSLGADATFNALIVQSGFRPEDVVVAAGGATTLPGAGMADIKIVNKAVINPVAGILVRLNDELKFGLSWRGKSEIPVELGIINHVSIFPSDQSGVRLAAFVPLNGVVDTTAFFTPEQVTAGLAWRVSDRLNLSFDLTYAMWHDFESSQITGSFEKVRVGSGTLAMPEGSLTLAPPARPRFRDIVIPRVGIEYELSGPGSLGLVTWNSMSVRFGYFYHPSPVKDPKKGRVYFPRVPVIDDPPGEFLIDFADPTLPGFGTHHFLTAALSNEPNIADASYHGFSFGISIEQDDPLGLFDKPQTLDFHFQYIVLNDRSFRTRLNRIANRDFGKFVQDPADAGLCGFLDCNALRNSGTEFLNANPLGNYEIDGSSFAFGVIQTTRF